MAGISTYLQKILDAVYGEEVRGSIHDALEAMNKESSSAMDYAYKAKDSATASATAAKKSETNAAASANTATQKASVAQTSASNASASATAAKKSETNAAASANTATQKASEADASARAAQSYAANAAASEEAAARQASEAVKAAGAAKESERNAFSMANAAIVSQNAAKNSERIVLENKNLLMGMLEYSDILASANRLLSDYASSGALSDSDGNPVTDSNGDSLTVVGIGPEVFLRTALEQTRLVRLLEFLMGNFSVKNTLTDTKGGVITDSSGNSLYTNPKGVEGFVRTVADLCQRVDALEAKMQ